MDAAALGYGPRGRVHVAPKQNAVTKGQLDHLADPGETPASLVHIRRAADHIMLRRVRRPGSWLPAKMCSLVY